MMQPLPRGAAIVLLGPGGAALGRRVRDLLPQARLCGPRTAPSADWGETYDRLMPFLAALFAAGRPIVGICASGILIRALAPLLDDKQQEPPVVALAADGSAAVPLLGGHHGANALARALAEGLSDLNCIAAITTAGDLRLGFALDEPPPGWRIANPAQIKPLAAALLAGEEVALVEEVGPADWLRAGRVAWSRSARRRVVVTDRECPEKGGPDVLVYHPPMLALGIGCERGAAPDEVVALARESLAACGRSPGSVAAVVSVALKADEPAIYSLAGALGVPARFFPPARLLEETARLTIRSEAAFRAVGCWGVAEGAALAAAGKTGELILPRRQSRRATCAIARAPAPLDPEALGRPRGRLMIVGIGPGAAAWRTPEAAAMLDEADDIVGYRLYLDLLGPAIAGKRRHDGALGAEEERVRLALDLAAEGRAVALVSSGDAGIYGLAALVFELLDREKRRDWGAVAIEIAPGVSAMQAAAARLGAPLGHDFCAISLSDLLTPWPRIEARIRAAAAADFVVALYNPRSSLRPDRLAEAAALLLAGRDPATPCALARNIGRPGESCLVLPLSELAAADADMLTLVLVGNSQTRLLPGEPPRLYTPRGYLNGDRS